LHGWGRGCHKNGREKFEKSIKIWVFGIKKKENPTWELSNDHFKTWTSRTSGDNHLTWSVLRGWYPTKIIRCRQWKPRKHLPCTPLWELDFEHNHESSTLINLVCS
jgi:hypothetical protein